MRAMVVNRFGGPEVLELSEVPLPEPGAGEVRVVVKACGVNFADTLITKGQYQVKPPFPFSPGLEVAGVVDVVGPGVSGISEGDRVLAMAGHGGFAEAVCVPADRAVVMPADMDFVQAAAFAVAYGTSEVALAYKARLQPGEVLLVHGAAGGVGLTAVEIGKTMGATVIATARGAEKLAVAKEKGADHLIDTASEDIRERVKELTGGKGADVVYDPVGGDVFDASLRCIAFEGRMLVIGFASGTVPQVPANIILVKNVDVLGFYWGAYASLKPQVIRDSFTRLFTAWGQGGMRPHVSHTLPLAKADEALKLMLSRKATGKIVVTME